MQLEFPTTTGFNGMFIVGFRRNPNGGNAQRVGTFILKRGYEIDGNQLIPTSNDSEIKIRDDISTYNFDGDTYVRTTHENDLAIFKPTADLIVTGFYEENDTCEAQVANDSGVLQTWFSRNGAVPTQSETGEADVDASINMFGWEQRGLEPRSDLIDTSDTEAPITSNDFFNAHRRIFAQTNFPLTQFPSNADIVVDRIRPSDPDEQTSFTLLNEQISARLFVYDGRGPDKRGRWCCHAIDDIRLDTLVVQPENNQAYVIWRGSWDFDAFPAEGYRLLQVNAQEAA